MTGIREKQLEKRKQETLDVALRLLLQRGYANLNMDELAVEAGISKPTLYQYFDSKEDLAAKAMARMFEKMGELIPEPSEEPTFDDVLFRETQEAAEKLALNDDEDTHEVDDEGEEKVKPKVVPLYARMAEMTVSQKIRCATLGTAAERLLCVRDSNRLVAAAAAKSPLLKEPEAVQISASRAVSEDVLRLLAMNKEFTRNYQIKLNLVANPRTPFTFAARLVPMLRESELKMLSKSKNVTGAISTATRQQLAKKSTKQGGG